MSYRIKKVESLIKEEISGIILFRLNDPLLGFITITNVKVSPDLKIATIYVSVFEKEKRDATLQKLNASIPMIRSELASKISLRFVPDLRFFVDDTLDYVEKIDILIKKIHKDDNKEQP